ncbi:unnamed protein product [Absidia cylindrospora]
MSTRGKKRLLTVPRNPIIISDDEAPPIDDTKNDSSNPIIISDDEYFLRNPKYGDCREASTSKPVVYIRQEPVDYTDIERMCADVKQDPNTTNINSNNNQLQPGIPHSPSQVVPSTNPSGDQPSCTDFPTAIPPLIAHYLQDDGLLTFAQINKQCYQAAIPLLWQAPKINSKTILQSMLTSLAMPSSSSLGWFIRTLKLKSNVCTDTDFLFLMPYLRRVETMEIINSLHHRMTEVSLQPLFYYVGQHLTSLHLYRVTLTPYLFNALGRSCRRLRHLVLHHSMPSMWPDVFVCPLETFHLLVPCGGPAYDNDTANMIMDRLMRLPGLKQLMIINMNTSSPSLGFVNAHVPSPIPPPPPTTHTHWPLLTRLRLDNCNNIKDNQWISFVQSHRHLQHVTLMNAPLLTDLSLDVMTSDVLPGLTHVAFTCMNGISADGVYRLICHAQQLMSLRLTWCDCIMQGDFPQDNSQQQRWTLPMVCLNQMAMDKIRARQKPSQNVGSFT